MSLYLDASVLLPQFVEEESSDMVRRWFETVDGPLFVSDFAAGEFGSALSRYVRMRRMSAADADSVQDDFEFWSDAVTRRIEVASADIRLAARLVRQPEPKLLMPDAIHLAVSQRLSLQLVTFDKDLVRAAAARGFDVVRPE